jgi:glycosyltransferase involved in cell wall biosynthesis
MADFELLVVGDSCTDESAKIVASAGDARIRWINLPANTGHQAGPNNRGLAEARGEFVAYLGHDDLWLPHHLDTLTKALDQSGDAMAHSLLAGIKPGGVAYPIIPLPRRGQWGPPSCTMHRSSVAKKLGGWRDYREIKVPPEIDLWRRAHSAGYSFCFVPRLTGV